jgi:hypothetical protein
MVSQVAMVFMTAVVAVASELDCDAAKFVLFTTQL